MLEASWVLGHMLLCTLSKLVYRVYPISCILTSNHLNFLELHESHDDGFSFRCLHILSRNLKKHFFAIFYNDNIVIIIMSNILPASNMTFLNTIFKINFQQIFNICIINF